MGYTAPPQKYSNYAKISCFAAKSNRKAIHLFLSQNNDFTILSFCAVIIFATLVFENILSTPICQLSSSDLTDYLVETFFPVKNTLHVKKNREQYNIKGTLSYYLITKCPKVEPCPSLPPCSHLLTFGSHASPLKRSKLKCNTPSPPPPPAPPLLKKQ